MIKSIIVYLYQQGDEARKQRGLTMLTQEEVERFADWIIAQENKMLAARYPITPEMEAMTDDEILAELFS